MASINIKNPKQLTGDNNVDLQEMRSYLTYLVGQLNYILNNLDEDNIINWPTGKEK